MANSTSTSADESPGRSYRAHPAADRFPLMDAVQLEALSRDIERNDLLEEIVRHKGQILDGRNRYLACGMTEKPRREPRFREWDGECGSPVAYVLSKNLHGRRHLSPEQRVFIAVAMLPDLEAEAAQRQKGGKTLGPNGPQVDKGRATELAAAAAGVSRKTVERARRVQDSGNAKLVEAVKHAEISIGDAAAALDGGPELLAEALPAVLAAVRSQAKGQPKTLAAWLRARQEPARAEEALPAPCVTLPAVAESERARAAASALASLGVLPEVTSLSLNAAAGFVVLTIARPIAGAAVQGEGGVA